MKSSFYFVAQSSMESLTFQKSKGMYYNKLNQQEMYIPYSLT